MTIEGMRRGIVSKGRHPYFQHVVARALAQVLVKDGLACCCVCFDFVLGLLSIPGIRAGTWSTDGEAQPLRFTICGRFSRPFRGLKLGVAIAR